MSGSVTDGPAPRRILIVGLASLWGGRLAQQLERHAGVETVVGIDTRDPRHELDRTEFVRIAAEPALVRRIVRAAGIDAVVDVRLLEQPPVGGRGRPGANGVGAILDALSGPHSSVRKLVLPSSTAVYGSSAGDPAFFAEAMEQVSPPRSPLGRAAAAMEAAARAFAEEHPAVTVSIARVAEPLGPAVESAWTALLGLPVIPAQLGFDPRLQFVHEEDVLGALAYLLDHELPGALNVAGDGVLALSEVAALLGKPLLPVLPPWGTGLAARTLRRTGLPVPVELAMSLRHGRGVDNRRLKASGFTFRYTTREALLAFRARQRLRGLLSRGAEEYRYEPEVEEFLRRSRSLPAPAQPERDPAGLSELPVSELLAVIGSLEPQTLGALHDYEAAHAAREEVLAALQRRLASARRRT